MREERGEREGIKKIIIALPLVNSTQYQYRVLFTRGIFLAKVNNRM
jgi:hypothetical protein